MFVWYFKLTGIEAAIDVVVGAGVEVEVEAVAGVHVMGSDRAVVAMAAEVAVAAEGETIPVLI